MRVGWGPAMSIFNILCNANDQFCPISFFYDKSKIFAGEAMHERKQGRNAALQVLASKISIHFTMGGYTLEILYH